MFAQGVSQKSTQKLNLIQDTCCWQDNGNNLQIQMLKYLDEYVKSKSYKIAIGTIHPDNIYSINNLIKDGFILTGSRSFKRGPRNIYVKKLINK